MQENTNTQEHVQVAVMQTGQDLKNAVLIFSVLINLALFTTWLVIQADASYGLVLTHSV